MTFPTGTLVRCDDDPSKVGVIVSGSGVFAYVQFPVRDARGLRPLEFLWRELTPILAGPNPRSGFLFRVDDPADALELAESEYRTEPLMYGPGWAGMSRGSTGGFHIRETFRTVLEADVWRERRIGELRDRLLTDARNLVYRSPSGMTGIV